MGTQICGYIKFVMKFQVSGREYQNICVLCISCEQKNICAFFHICFLPYVQNIPCELAFSSDVVLCCLFLVSEFRWRFTLCLLILCLARLGLLSGHLLGKSCSLG